LFGAAGHSPNQGTLATRKVCQNDEFLDTFAPLTRLGPGHISAGPKSVAMALISLAFLAVEPWIAEFPLIWRTHPDRASGAMRHDELMGKRVENVMAALPNRENRNLA
jgi:hypothetical protein